MVNLTLNAWNALDVELFNHDMNELLAGKAVNLPIFNFKTGKREYKDKIMQLGKDDVLVIEGIHGLNDKLSYSLPVESKFKIYISALTQLNIDEHNYLPTTDGRTDPPYCARCKNKRYLSERNDRYVGFRAPR